MLPMPAPATLADATLYAAAALALALAAIWIARPLRRAMLAMIVVLLVGLAMLAGLERFGPDDRFDPVAIAVREFALVLIALGVLRVALIFVFQGLLVRARIPRILTDVLFALALVAYALYRMRVGGVNLAGIITTSAVITGVIVFSLQETLGNLWGGIALQLDNTCRLGDWIRVDAITGQIVGIRWRCVAVATNDGETVMIPNAQLIKNKVTVLARRGDQRTAWRRHVPFRVAYSAPPPRVIAIVEEALARAEIPHVARTPVPLCVTEATEDHGIRFAVLYWLDDLLQDVQTDARVLAHALAALARQDIEWPLPRRVVLTPSAMTEQRAAAAAQSAGERSNVLGAMSTATSFRSRATRPIRCSCSRAAGSRYCATVTTRAASAGNWAFWKRRRISAKWACSPVSRARRRSSRKVTCCATGCRARHSTRCSRPGPSSPTRCRTSSRHAMRKTTRRCARSTRKRVHATRRARPPSSCGASARSSIWADARTRSEPCHARPTS